MTIKDLILDRLEVTQEEFCRAVGISRTTFYFIMNEKHEPSMVTIKKICKYFDVDFRDYLEG